MTSGPAAAADAGAPDEVALRDARALDEVVLRDGRHIRGRLVEQAPGRWVIVETEDGRRHTYAWDAIAELDNGSAPRNVDSAAKARAAWERRTDESFSYGIRVSASTLLFPEKTLGLSGYCSNTVSTSPVSIYGNTASAKGVGFGGGIGGRAGFMRRSRPDPSGTVSWWAFRAGAGLDLQLFHARVPADIRPFQGELCTLVARMNHEVRYETKAFLVLQVPLHLGGSAAIGKFVDATRWRGVVIGAAWAPALVHAGAFSAAASTSVNPLGVELTLDFVVLVADASRSRPDGQLRFALAGMAPSTDRQFTYLSLSMGIVYY